MKTEQSYHFIYNENETDPYARFYFFSGSALRITFARNHEFSEPLFADDVLLPHCPVNEPFSDMETAGTGRLADTSCDGLGPACGRGRNSIRIMKDGDTKLSFMAGTDSAKPRIEIDTHPGEGFYGFGEWFNGFRRESGSLELYNRESPSFTQHKHTYSAFPCFLSDRGYMVLVLNAHRGKALINKPRGKLTLDFDGGILDIVVIYGPSRKQLLREYTALTGRPPLLPLWSFGLWNTSYPVENQEETLSRIDEHRRRNFPLDAVIFDYHWEEGFHDFRWRKRVFPGPENMLAEMKRQGVKAGLIYTPYINGPGVPLYKLLARLYAHNAPKGVPFLSEDAAGELYTEGLKNNYFAHPKVTWWLGRGGAVDFTNSVAVDWWFKRQKALMDQGVYFFKNDGGEYLPENSASAAGLDTKEFHNIYGFYYARAAFMKSQEYHGDRRAMVFSRTTWAGTQRYPGIFLGDQTPEFKHIASTIRCGLNMSLLGFAYWGADVLGLYRKPSAKIHRRYSQWALFTPIARYFSAPGDDTRNPWGINRECGENFLRHLNLRIRLLPYFYRLAHEAFSDGIPIMRPLLLEFEEDRATLPIGTQVMIGDSLMMAPVMGFHFRTKKIYFPAGTWYDWWTGTRHDGPAWRRLPLDPGHLPLFVRGGYPVILGPELQYIPESHRFDELEAHIYPPFDGETYLYEDDGATTGYLNGAFAMQKLVFKTDRKSALISITLGAAMGDFPERPAERRLGIVLHFTPEVTAVLKNDTPLGQEDYSADHFICRAAVVEIKAVVPTDTATTWTVKYRDE